MKTADTKTATQARSQPKEQAPFFRKGEEGAAFFSEVQVQRKTEPADGREAAPFFRPQANGEAFFQLGAGVQTKLKVGRPGDKYEREADGVADAVVENAGGEVHSSSMSGGEGQTGTVQAKCETCAREEPVRRRPLVQRITSIGGRGDLHRKCAACAAREGKEQAPIQLKPIFESEGQPELQMKTAEPPVLQKQEKEEKTLQEKESELKAEAEKEPLQTKPIFENEVQLELQAKAADPPVVQRQNEEEEVVQEETIEPQAEWEEAPLQRKPVFESEVQPELQAKAADPPVVHRQEEEEELVQEEEIEPPSKAEEDTSVQLQATGENGAGADIENRLKGSKGGGSPLETPVRSEMEGQFGVDFSGVRVHTGSDAEGLSKDLGAQAFTHGNDIYFNAGKYRPESEEGRHLLAHELTHTVQQGASVSRLPEIQRQEDSDHTDYAEELAESNREAEQAVDPTPAEQARAQAEREAQAAEEQAEQQTPEVEPEPGTGGKQKKEESRTAEPKQRPPDTVTPSVPEEEPKGPVGKDLEEASAGVCRQGAEKAQQLANNQQAHDDAGEKLEQTESAVEPPAEENQSRSNAEQVENLEEAPAPDPDREAARSTLTEAVEDSVPSSVEEMNEFESKGKAEVIGNQVLEQTSHDVGEVQGTYSEIENTPPAPPPERPEPLPETETAPETPPLNLGEEAVPPLEDDHTDVSEFEEQSDQLLEKEGISEEQLEMVDSGDLAEAKKERKDLKKKVDEEPAKVQEFARQKQEQVKTGMQQEETQAKAEMKAKREEKLNASRQEQQQAKSEMELKREKVTQHIQQIYKKAEEQVKTKLDKLEKDSLARFDREQKRYSKLFEREVKRDINAWKRERYSGLFAGVKWLRDKLFGIDEFPEVKQAFERARVRYVERIDKLIVTITEDNERVIQECKDILAKARLEIKEYVDGLGPDLRATGQSAMQKMQAELKKLDGFIEEKKKALQQKLCDKKEEAIKAIDKKIEQMKSEMSGLVSKLGNLLLNAMLKFFEWALEKMGGGEQVMGVINKGKEIITRIVKDPIQFFKNLGKAVGGGIDRFVANIKQHLIRGLIGWLTGAMGDAGITLPDKFDLKGILSVVLQIANLTWTAIRTKLVKRVGERIVSAAEKGIDIVKRVIAEGPVALWNIIKEKAVELKAQVLEGIRNWAITQIVKKAAVKLISMLNPVGAIFQAIMAIYDVVMFFIENWDRIVNFVKSIFSSIGEIAMGAIGKAAAFIENALAQTIPIILNFLARFLGLSGIGKAIRNVIKRIRRPIDRLVNKIVSFLAKKVKRLFGIGKKGKKEKEKSNNVKSKVAKELKAKLGREQDPNSIKNTLKSILNKFRKDGLKSLKTIPKKDGTFTVIAVASPGSKVGAGKIKTPTLTVGDLNLGFGTVLIASLNGNYVPPTGKFRNNAKGHAEENLDRAIRRNWSSLKKEGRNGLIVRITRSPCNRCTPLLSKLKSDLSTSESFLDIKLKIMSDLGGKKDFDKNEKLFRRLRKKGIEIETWNVFGELRKFGIRKSDIPEEKEAEIKRRIKQVKEVIKASELKLK